jgi:hypothetical protein
MMDNRSKGKEMHPETSVGDYRLFWYLSYAYFQNKHFFNAAFATIKDALSRLEDIFYKKQWEQIQINKPIFIIGPHRSGTTILQWALSSDSCIATPRSYSDVLDMEPILAKGFMKFVSRGHSRRRVDDIVVNFDSPQEAQGLISRYFYRDTVLYNPYSEKDIYNYMRKLLFLEGKSRFLWKSPYISIKIPEINYHFPDAQYIYIHRDPITCVSSKLKFIKIWQEIAKSPSNFYRHFVGKTQDFELGGAGYFMEQANRTVNLLETHPNSIKMTEDHLHWIRKAINDLNNLNASDRCCFIDFETLTDEPKESLGRIFEFLQLPDESDDIILKMGEIGMPFRKTSPHYDHIPEDDLPAVRELCGSHLQKISSAINWDNFFVIGAKSLR